MHYTNSDGVHRVEQVTDPAFYQRFFSQLEKDLFIAQEGI